MKKPLVDNKYMARVYLAQAKATKHRAWAFKLLEMAARNRLESMKPQKELFNDYL